MNLDDVKARIQARCAICPECGAKWLWVGNNSTEMHRAMIEVDGKRYGVKTTVYKATYGDPVRPCVVTTCHEPACLNPELLKSVSKRHIVMRSIKEGKILNAEHRLMIVKGRRSRDTKLDMEKAQTIRSSDKPMKELARDYGVSPETIRRVKSMEQWVPFSNPFSGLGAK